MSNFPDLKDLPTLGDDTAVIRARERLSTIEARLAETEQLRTDLAAEVKEAQATAKEARKAALLDDGAAVAVQADTDTDKLKRQLQASIRDVKVLEELKAEAEETLDNVTEAGRKALRPAYKEAEGAIIEQALKAVGALQDCLAKADALAAKARGELMSFRPSVPLSPSHIQRDLGEKQLDRMARKLQERLDR
ncbi:MAG: hypothetical protein FKY71_10875 [Spiribacter salinus]|uniref:PspA/IM30 family protein n=1 Tax=Spiribacter salinus TaxID=1335746 RepID=A0A540VQF9_9GAMM|nr:MAG: hypothetical protein FKY71_10875 [Spiribacter salinus]